MCSLVKNENFVSCILKCVSNRDSVLEAVVLDKVNNRQSNIPGSNFSMCICHHCDCGITVRVSLAKAIHNSFGGPGSQRAKEVTSYNERRTAGWQKLSLEELLTWIAPMKRGAAEMASVYRISAFSLEASICETHFYLKGHMALFILLLQLLSLSFICL